MIFILTYLMSTYSVPFVQAWPLAQGLHQSCTAIDQARTMGDDAAEDRAGDRAVNMIDDSGLDFQLDEVCGE